MHGVNEYLGVVLCAGSHISFVTNQVRGSSFTVYYSVFSYVFNTNELFRLSSARIVHSPQLYLCILSLL